ncbi:MAG: flagellar hook-length control protein FliK [Planctomycetaceae bacterium]|jgi:hypothetical protein|nr:flagellar hook-length control protein FliK [Planctomycetaceae bacterium]
MSVDNPTTYSSSPAVVSSTGVKNSSLNTLMNGNSSGIIVTNIKNNSATSVGKNIIIETLLRESDRIKQPENADDNNIIDNRNDKKNTETTRIDNKQLDKKLLNQTELDNTEINTNYNNQLERREQIHNEYLNRLNRREINKSETLQDSTKNLLQNEIQPFQLVIDSDISNQSQAAASGGVKIVGNITGNEDRVRFLNASNHRAAVREALEQNMSNVDSIPIEISVTIITLEKSAQKESNRPIANGRQTTFTIFTPTGRIEQIEYDKNQNNRQKQNDEKSNDDSDNKKEKNKNKKNYLELLQSDNLQSDNLLKKDYLVTDVDSNKLNESSRQKNYAIELSDIQFYDDTNDIFESDIINVKTSGKNGFDLSQLPEFIVTILSEPIKFEGQIDFRNKNSKDSNDANNAETDNDNYDNVNVNVNNNAAIGADDLNSDEISWRSRLMLRVTAARRSMSNRNGAFRIKFNLDDSGELFIKITKNKGNYSVLFTATNIEIAQNLNNGLTLLKQSLSEDNVKLEDVEITVGQI